VRLGDATEVDAWEALLLERQEDDGLPCYHLMKKYSTGVLGAHAYRQCKRPLPLAACALASVVPPGRPPASVSQQPASAHPAPQGLVTTAGDLFSVLLGRASAARLRVRH
jgi:hypothetical protein